MMGAKKEQPMPSPKLTPADYLKKILTARVYDVAVESALEPAKNLSLRLKNRPFVAIILLRCNMAWLY